MVRQLYTIACERCFRQGAMDIRNIVRFYLNDELVELADVPSRQTVLDFLRLDRALKGTKEGCAEGDCGACTVLVGRLDAGDRLVYETINACIRFVATLDGTHLVTVEHLAAEGELHPVQRAMVDNHASQCGFCTPGIVMSLYGDWLDNPQPSVAEVEQTLQGNLCRCTGYSSILKAAQAVSSYGDAADDRLNAGRAAMADRLVALRDTARLVTGGAGARAVLPGTADDLAAVLEAEPDATIVSGATDVGLWITKFLREPPTMVFLNRIRELDAVEIDAERVLLGARVSYATAMETLGAQIPALGRLLSRIGGAQVRNAGTIGGNIANGSPIGDTPPALIALGASMTLRQGQARRTVALEDFFIDYGKQDRRPGEFIETISVPLPKPDELFAVYKVTKRFDEDISSVLGAFRLRIAGGVVAEAHIAYGGMAATPKRARAVEAVLTGQAWNRDSVAAGMVAFEADFQPLTDWRASAGYRMTVARNLLLRLWAETAQDGATEVRELIHG